MIALPYGERRSALVILLLAPVESLGPWGFPPRFMPTAERPGE